MKKTKSNAGRPAKELKSKQINVRMPLVELEDPRLQEKIKYMSFSQYVRSLIDNDLKGVPSLQK